MLLLPLAAMAGVDHPGGGHSESRSFRLFPQLKASNLKPFLNVVPLSVAVRKQAEPPPLRSGPGLLKAYFNYVYTDSSRHLQQVPVVLSLARANAAGPISSSGPPIGKIVTAVDGQPASWVQVRVTQANPAEFQAFVAALSPPQREAAVNGLGARGGSITFSLKHPADSHVVLEVTIYASIGGQQAA